MRNRFAVLVVRKRFALAVLVLVPMLGGCGGGGGGGSSLPNVCDAEAAINGKCAECKNNMRLQDADLWGNIKVVEFRKTNGTQRNDHEYTMEGEMDAEFTVTGWWWQYKGVIDKNDPDYRPDCPVVKSRQRFKAAPIRIGFEKTENGWRPTTLLTDMGEINKQIGK